MDEKIINIKTVFDNSELVQNVNTANVIFKEFDKSIKDVGVTSKKTTKNTDEMGNELNNTTKSANTTNKAFINLGNTLGTTGKVATGTFRVFDVGARSVMGNTLGRIYSMAKAVSIITLGYKLLKKGVSAAFGVLEKVIAKGLAMSYKFADSVRRMTMRLILFLNKIGVISKESMPKYIQLMQKASLMQRGYERTLYKTAAGIDKVTNKIRTSSKNLEKNSVAYAKSVAKGKEMIGTTKNAGTLAGKLSGIINKSASIFAKHGVAVSSWITSLGLSAKVIGGVGLAVLALGKIVSGFIVKYTDMADLISKSAQKIGFDTQAYQAWDVTLQHAGTSMDTMSMGIVRLQDSMSQARKPTTEQAKAFRQLGVDVEGSDGKLKDTNKVFEESILALSSMKNQTERQVLATKLFGRQSKELGPLLNSGTDAIRSQMEASKDLVVVDKDMETSSVAVADTLLDLQKTWQKLTTKAMKPFVNMYLSVIQSIKKTNIAKMLTGPLTVIGAAFTALGIVVTTVMNGILVAVTTVEVAAEGLFLLLTKGIKLLSKIPGVPQEWRDFINDMDAKAVDDTADATKRLGEQLKLLASGATGGALFKDTLLNTGDVKKGKKISTGDGSDTGDDKTNTKAEARAKGLSDALALEEQLRTARLQKSLDGRNQLLFESYQKRLATAQKYGVSTLELDKWYDREFFALQKESREKELDELDKAKKAEMDILHGKLAFKKLMTDKNIANMADGKAKELAILQQAEDAELARIKEMYDGKLELKTEYEEAYNQITLDYASKRAEINTQTQEQQAIATSEQFNTAVGNISQATNKSMEFANQIFAMQDANSKRSYDNWYNNEKAKINVLNVTSKRRGQLNDKLQKEADAKRKEEGEKQKKWAIASALINGALGLTNALTTQPLLPMGIIMAALVAASTVASVAAISSQSFATGGVVKNTSGSVYGDKEIVSVNPGERVLTQQQNSQYEKGIASQTVTVNQTFNGPVNEDSVDRLESVNNEFLTNLENGLEELQSYGRLPSLA